MLKVLKSKEGTWRTLREVMVMMVIMIMIMMIAVRNIHSPLSQGKQRGLECNYSEVGPVKECGTSGKDAAWPLLIPLREGYLEKFL